MLVIWRRKGGENKAFVGDKEVKKLRGNSSTRYDMPENQGLQFKLLPLLHAEVTSSNSHSLFFSIFIT